ncbi:MAG: NYN domain-containing protein [Candidatus Tectomicrobia bacterium]|uniref:NYN domain-containing protein n=1 Tax=Tectimicrobiota bacterium TaxID=2528274 RepID=A0A932HWC3_UNCTE|nr:NYN domain-containing protein [Candidatus Tectomicrobia bacterium]
MKLLIDGYNLIPAIPELGRLLRRDLEAGREALLGRLRAYRRAAREPLSITVAFDGKGGAGAGPGGGGIRVLFSRNETADELILRLLRGEMKGAVLVTSDRALGAAAQGQAGAVLRSGEFAGRLERAQAPASSAEPWMDEEKPEEAPPARSLTTKKKGNPRKLPKKERERKRRLDKL